MPSLAAEAVGRLEVGGTRSQSRHLRMRTQRPTAIGRPAGRHVRIDADDVPGAAGVRDDRSGASPRSTHATRGVSMSNWSVDGPAAAMGHAGHPEESREARGVAAVGGSETLVPGRRVVHREDGVAHAVVDDDLGAAVPQQARSVGFTGCMKERADSLYTASVARTAASILSIGVVSA